MRTDMPERVFQCTIYLDAMGERVRQVFPHSPIAQYAQNRKNTLRPTLPNFIS